MILILFLILVSSLLFPFSDQAVRSIHKYLGQNVQGSEVDTEKQILEKKKSELDAKTFDLESEMNKRRSDLEGELALLKREEEAEFEKEKTRLKKAMLEELNKRLKKRLEIKEEKLIRMIKKKKVSYYRTKKAQIRKY